MQTMEQWLAVATRGLCAAAAACVRAEIGDHYQSALETARTAGLDAAESENRAVAALGNAKTANRQYRRVLLTKLEDHLRRGMMPVELQMAGVSKRRRLLGQTMATILLLEALVPLVVLAIWRRGFGYPVAAFILDGIMFNVFHVDSIRAGWIIRGTRWGVLAAGVTMAMLSGVSALLSLSLLLGAAYFEYKRFVLRAKLPKVEWPVKLYN